MVSNTHLYQLKLKGPVPPSRHQLICSHRHLIHTQKGTICLFLAVLVSSLRWIWITTRASITTHVCDPISSMSKLLMHERCEFIVITAKIKCSAEENPFLLSERTVTFYTFGFVTICQNTMTPRTNKSYSQTHVFLMDLSSFLYLNKFSIAFCI